jgi:hypothetical protein
VIAKRAGVPVVVVPLLEWLHPLHLITVLNMTGITLEQLERYVYG